MKFWNKAYSSLQLLPALLVAWSIGCFALSFVSVFDKWVYDEWFRDYSAKTIECPLLFVAVLVILAAKNKWSVFSWFSIASLLILNIGDIAYMHTNDLNNYGMWFAIAVFGVGMIYGFYEMRD